MRGKALENGGGSLDVRITPAYAGKRRWWKQRGRLSRDHPRVCGEKSYPPPPLGKVLGSPPRMRGKAVVFLSVPVTSGITPAYAGKSKSRQWRGAVKGDHPRVCGEKNLS